MKIVYGKNAGNKTNIVWAHDKMKVDRIPRNVEELDIRGISHRGRPTNKMGGRD